MGISKPEDQAKILKELKAMAKARPKPTPEDIAKAAKDADYFVNLATGEDSYHLRTLRAEKEQLVNLAAKTVEASSSTSEKEESESESESASESDDEDEDSN